MGTRGKSGLETNLIADDTMSTDIDNIVDKYVIVTSQQNLEYFPSNEANSFRCIIPMGDVLTGGDYECALVDFACSTIPFKGKPLKQIAINFDAVEHSHVNGKSRQTVRMITVKSNHFQMRTLVQPLYIRVSPLTDSTFQISIYDLLTDTLASFLKDMTTCTFHFRKSHNQLLWKN